MNNSLTETLKQLMNASGVVSFRDLCDRSALTRYALQNVRQGQAELLKYKDLVRLAEVLQISPMQIIQTFSSLPDRLPKSDPNSIELKAEYQRLQQQLDRQRQESRIEFQQETLQQLEALLLQLPTAAYAAQQNPTMPARNLLPLLRPIDRLLQRWGIESIDRVGSEVAYDPHSHQLMDANEVETGEPVTVRYIGYRQGDKLLYRARVSRKN